MSTQYNNKKNTIDPQEIERFSALSEKWWDTKGEFAPLHHFNPVRLEYIRKKVCNHFQLDRRNLQVLEGLKVLDVGCGGGLVTEPIARMGASTIGIDASERCVGVARHHAEMNQLNIDYRISTAEILAKEKYEFDIILALEIIEHVQDRDLFIQACTKLIKPGGIGIFATLNRTAKSFFQAILGAEYVLRWLPRGTHQWDRFVKPSELVNSLKEQGLIVSDISGVKLNIFKKEWFISNDIGVNYVLCAEKPKGRDIA
tara:strand:- start:45 stop:815 length:771 start_codon:yes stop_codon:yes gene_type:complete